MFKNGPLKYLWWVWIFSILLSSPLHPHCQTDKWSHSSFNLIHYPESKCALKIALQKYLFVGGKNFLNTFNIIHHHWSTEIYVGDKNFFNTFPTLYYYQWTNKYLFIFDVIHHPESKKLEKYLWEIGIFATRSTLPSLSDILINDHKVHFQCNSSS